MHVDEPSTFSTVLRDYWHPVVRAEDVKDGPYAVTLLDERIVLFRSGGQMRCFQDLCVHRGTPHRTRHEGTRGRRARRG